MSEIKQEAKEKKQLGRPRKHDPQDWTLVQFRLPKNLRSSILEKLAQKNAELTYRLSLNSFLLELIGLGLSEWLQSKEEPTPEEYSEDRTKHLLLTTPSSLTR